MKQPIKLLAFLLSVLVFDSVISTVNATITKEYPESTSYDIFDNKRFSFKVKMTIETEANNKWLTNHHYDITFIITLIYVNDSMFPLGLTVDFYSPFQLGLTNVEQLKVLWNSTTVSSGSSGSLLVQVYNTLEERRSVNPTIDYKTYSEKFTSGGWFANEPTYIDMESPSQLFTVSRELIFMGIGIVLGAVVVGGYFIIKTRKTRKPL